MKLLVPGLRNSGPEHWQSYWQRSEPDGFVRVEQTNWQAPERSSWVKALAAQVRQYKPESLILIGHSLGCATIVHFLAQHPRLGLKGVMLVAPSDVEAEGYASYIRGFAPLPLEPLPCPSLLVASSNDPVVRPERARYFAQQWGSRFHLLFEAGHIEDKSGYGPWPEGRELLAQLG